MKLKKIEITNYKCIDNLKFQIPSEGLLIQGRNASGKTSIIQALFAQISNSPINNRCEDKSKFKIQIDYDNDYCLVFKHNKKTEKICEYVYRQEEELYGVAGFIKKTYGENKQSISDIIGSSYRNQFNELKHVCGVDFYDVDNEYKKCYKDRTIVSRRIKELENTLSVLPIKRLGRIEYKQDVGKLILDFASNVTGKSTEDIVSLYNIIEASIQHNYDVDYNIMRKSFSDELNILYKEEEEINYKMKDIELHQQQIMEENNKSIFNFDDSSITIGGIEFEPRSINTATQILAQFDYNLSRLGNLRAMHFDITQLDSSSLQHLILKAKDNDVQLFLEKVSNNELNTIPINEYNYVVD